eukprot:CAMPEP_0170210214 /NCGR_PEP_ID=MMETSP0116_2-20130129/4706_1 /TAXON_ID=400756 /ORGANISM="Durinskia baltica, Strain CSIRO CS-38" /LENGTH=348 /DNA_ID=CAMNT_0010460715 /DNA_START=88 /DNA_END=1131 /DNA_ORIENTATION=-
MSSRLLARKCSVLRRTCFDHHHFSTSSSLGVHNLWSGEKAFENSCPSNGNERKPRNRGVSMCREPGLGLRVLADVCEAHGEYIDVLKIPWGGMRCQPKALLREKIALAKKFGIAYSTGGVLERVLLAGPDAVMRFLDEAATLGFEEIEISAGLTIVSLDSRLELMKAVKDFGMKPVPEVSMAFGVQKNVDASQIHPAKLVHEIQTFVAEGAHRVVIEEEGLTDKVKDWNYDVIFRIATCAPLEKLLFECDDRFAYSWYIKQFGPDVNFHIDLKDALHLETTRRGIWGKATVFGRVAKFNRLDWAGSSSRPISKVASANFRVFHVLGRFAVRMCPSFDCQLEVRHPACA